MVQTKNVKDYYRTNTVGNDQFLIPDNILGINMGIDKIKPEHQCQEIGGSYKDNIKDSESHRSHDPLFIIIGILPH